MKNLWPNNLRSGLLLMGILLLGSFLRFHGLGTASLWYDETVQARTAETPDILQSIERVPRNKPPLFYMAEFIAFRFSPSEWMLRLPSCWSGILSIWAIWYLGMFLLKDSRAALAAAALLAVSPLHITFSQEARPYALAMLFTLLSAGAFFAQLDRPRFRGVFFLAGWAALAAWTLYFSLLVWLLLAAYGTFYLVMPNRLPGARRGESRSRAVPGSCLVGLGLALVLLFPLIPHIQKQTPSSGSFPFPSFDAALLARILGWFAFGNEQRIVWPMAAAIIALAVAGVWSGFQRNPTATVFLLLWFAGLQGLQITGYALADHWIESRYHLHFLPPLLLLCGMGCAGLSDMMKRYKPALIGAGLLLLGLCAFQAEGPVQARWEWKSDIRSAVSDIRRRAGQEDIVVGSGFDTFFIYSYYKEHFFPEAPPIVDTRDFRALVARLLQASRVWVIGHRVFCAADYAVAQALAPALSIPPPSRPEITLVSGGPRALEAISKLPQFAVFEKELRRPPDFAFQAGDLDMARHIGPSWSQPEDWGGGTRPRWLEGREGIILFSFSPDTPSTVTLSAISLGAPFSGQTLSLWWDGEPIAESVPITAGGFTPVTASIPPEKRQPQALHWLRLRTGYAVSDTGLKTPNEDARNLSVCVAWVRFQ